jgi:hypothetical protein
VADGPVIRRGFQSQETLLPECTVNDQSALKQMLCAHVAEVGPERAWLIAWCDHVVLVGDVTAELAHTLEHIEPSGAKKVAFAAGCAATAWGQQER